MLLLICFCKNKKIKTCLKNMGQPDPTQNPIDPFKIDPFGLATRPTRPIRFAMST